jgi:single-strand DNA-binding protein
MANVNKVILIGNLTRDVELKNLSSGTAVAQIGLAINREWKDKDGEKKEEVTFVDCEAWGKTAEIMAKYLAKGKPVYVEGRLRLDVWDDKESGQKRSKIKVVVESFQFLSSGKGSDDAAPAEKPADKPAQRGFKQPGKESPAMNPDEIPFTWRGIDGF